MHLHRRFQPSPSPSLPIKPLPFVHTPATTSPPTPYPPSPYSPPTKTCHAAYAHPPLSNPLGWANSRCTYDRAATKPSARPIDRHSSAVPAPSSPCQNYSRLSRGLLCVRIHKRHYDAIIFQPALFNCSCFHHSLRSKYFLLLPSTSIMALLARWIVLRRNGIPRREARSLQLARPAILHRLVRAAAESSTTTDLTRKKRIRHPPHERWPPILSRNPHSSF